MSIDETAALPALAADFPQLSHEQWQGLVAKVLNRGKPEEKWLSGPAAEARLRSTTVDGLTLDPLYEADGDPAALGHPGVMPFTRGSGLTAPGAPWDVRQAHADPDPALTHKAVLADLERGATSVWIEVGTGAVAAADLEQVLGDVLVDLAPVAVSSVDQQVEAAEALLAVWRKRTSDAAAVRGSLGLDPIGAAARLGATPDLAALTRLAAAVPAEFAGVQVVTVDTTVHHDAGADDVEELALAVATGIEYLRALDAAGVAPAAAAPLIEFRVAATADQFATIAKLRALRRLWARVAEASGVPEELRGARLHAVTSRRMLTRDDPWVNMLRTTVAAFAASVGGAEAITVLPFDHVAGLPDDFSRRIARNTQVLLAEESHIAQVVDPAGGSWYVEHLTDDVARAAWAWLQELEAAGGLVAALAAGTVAERIAATVAERAGRLATRKLPLTGVSMFPKVDEELLVRRERPAGPAPVGPGALLPTRDAEVFEALRDRSAAHATATGAAPSVFLACLGARRDFGAREMFTSAMLGVAGLATPSAESPSADELAAAAAAAGAKVAVVCSSPKMNAEHGAAVADALHAAGVTTVYLAGRAKELGEGAGSVDAQLYDGVDVVATLTQILDTLGVQA